MVRSQLFRTISLLVLWAASSVSLVAEEIEGMVSGVDPQGVVEIRLPEGGVVAPGDPVKILAEIPGVGLTAIATRWEVESTAAGSASARPVEPPSGMPQVGYVARIETQATAVGDSEALPNTRSAAMEPEAGTIGGSAETTITPDAPALLEVPIPQEAETLYRRGMELFTARDVEEIASGTDFLRRAAAMRHPGAMSELGAAFTFGRGIERDEVMGRSWQEDAAKLGHARAMVRLGLIYATGYGVPVDEMMANEWLHKSAAYGDAHGMYLVAMFFEEGYAGHPPDWKLMLQWLEEAASFGSVQAMYLLGEIYLDGEDGIIRKDLRKSSEYLTQAAEAGHPPAMKVLADLWEGWDQAISTRWAAAAKEAEPYARDWDWTDDARCLSSWECYGSDDREALETSPMVSSVAPYPVVAPEGQPGPMTRDRQACDRLAASPRDPDLPDPGWAVPFDQIEAEAAIAACRVDLERWPGNRRFHTQLATALFKAGRYEEALAQMQQGADMGSGQSMAMIGLMHSNGYGVPQNKPKALQMYETAGGQGNVIGMHFAARMHLDADGVDYNPQAAAEWLQAAADLGSGEAMAELGILYDNRQGVPYDPDEAAANLMAGLAMGSPLAKRTLLEEYERLSPHTLTAIQQILRNDGLYSGALDGAFGPQTLQALRARITN